MSEGISKIGSEKPQPPQDEWEKFDLRFRELRPNPHFVDALTDLSNLYSLYARKYQYPPANESARLLYQETEGRMERDIDLHGIEFGEEYLVASSTLQEMIHDLRPGIAASFDNGTPRGATDVVIYDGLETRRKGAVLFGNAPDGYQSRHKAAGDK